jgi:hypothetical protein
MVKVPAVLEASHPPVNGWVHPLLGGPQDWPPVCAPSHVLFSRVFNHGSVAEVTAATPAVTVTVLSRNVWV